MQRFNPFLRTLTSQASEMEELLEALAQISSATKDVKGLFQMCRALKEAFAPLDAEMFLIPLPEVNLINASGSPVPTQLGHIFKVKKYPEAPIQILFGGHMDTVLPYDEKNFPLKKKGRMLRGPGVADMKGGLVIMLYALKLLESSPFKGQIGFEVCITPDEEIGSIASYNHWVKASQGKDFALLFEPCLPNGSLVSSRKGSMNFTVTTHGKTAHAGRDFFKGVNAIYALTRFISDAQMLTDEKRGITINPGVIQGGLAANIVPDKAFCRFNARMDNEADLNFIKEVIGMIKKLIEENQKNLTVDLYIESERPPKKFTSSSQKVFNALKICADHLKFDLQLAHSGGACDGNITASQGVATIDTLGVIGDYLHTENEVVYLDSLLERCQLASLFLLKLASQSFSKNKESF